MADVSKITLPDGTTYAIKDETARQLISEIDGYTDYIGVTTTALADGATTNPVIVEGKSVTAVKGNITNYEKKEFIFNGSAWQEFGDLSGLGSLAFKDEATGTYTPSGSVSKPTTTVELNTTTVNSITAVGTLPTFTVTGETLVLTAGTLPTKEDVTVATGVKSVDTTKPSFVGTKTSVTVS